MSAEWEKVLWKTQSYPDNYVPPSFLSALRKNPNFRPYTYGSLVLGACAICQHLATIFVFLAIFVRLREARLDPTLLVGVSIGAFAVGYAIWAVLDCLSCRKVALPSNGAKTFKSSILVFLSLMALAPVLRTLSAATSSDSIWALAAVLFGLNALLADYTPDRARPHTQAPLTSVLSMNAAISASVVLASRLADDASVFALALSAVQLFALFPLLRRRLQATSAPAHALSAAVLSGAALALTAELSATITALYAGILVFVTLVAPGVLVWAQRFKNEIRGPWDVAVPTVD